MERFSKMDSILKSVKERPQTLHLSKSLSMLKFLRIPLIATTASLLVFSLFLHLAAPNTIRFAAASPLDSKSKTLDVYWIDVEGGAATLFVTPAGESLLVDTGLPGKRDPGRIHHAITKVAGLKKLNYLVVTHFDRDHYGGTADLMKLLPIDHIYDPGLPEDNPRVMKRIQKYIEATKGKRKVLKPGDRLPLKSLGKTPLTIDCLAAAQKFIKPSTNEHKKSFSEGKNYPLKNKDLSQNANSTVLLIKFGEFDLLDAADLTWNLEHQLVFPYNLVGIVDVYQSDHHGLDSSNNPALIHRIEPTVAIINNGSRKGCEPGMFKTLKETKSIQAIFQVHRNVRVGDEGNTTSSRIANDKEKCSAELVKLSVDPSGKSYTVSIPSKGNMELFRSK